MNRKMANIAAFWPAVLVVPRYSACRAASRMLATIVPVRPTSIKVRRPSLSITVNAG